jgi:prophage antirepressor-like protein
MSNLQLVKSECFGNIQCDFYQDNDAVCMTAAQLGAALGYTDPQKGVDNLLSRNDYLRDAEFSVTLKLRGADEKVYDTRVFTEDGIYEVTMLAKTDKAREFKNWVRHVIKTIRRTGSYINQPLSQLEILAQAAQALLQHDQALKEIA